MANRETGTVKWFDPKKGYGFISSDSGDDLFVHYSEIEMDGFKKLEEGQKVTFYVSQEEKGKTAKKVKVL